jgi:nicotinamidase-related amidase
LCAHNVRIIIIQSHAATHVVTNICVEGSARAASELGFDVFIIEDACAAWSPEIHKNTLVSFEMMFGSVVTTDAVIEKVKENL